MDHIDWGAVTAALMVGAIAYLYRQARIVDQVRQALLGMDGRGGALDEIRTLRTRLHELNNTMAVLNTTVALLGQKMDRSFDREG